MPIGLRADNISVDLGRDRHEIDIDEHHESLKSSQTTKSFVRVGQNLGFFSYKTMGRVIIRQAHMSVGHKQGQLKSNLRLLKAQSPHADLKRSQNSSQHELLESESHADLEFFMGGLGNDVKFNLTPRAGNSIRHL